MFVVGWGCRDVDEGRGWGGREQEEDTTQKAFAGNPGYPHQTPIAGHVYVRISTKQQQRSCAGVCTHTCMCVCVFVCGGMGQGGGGGFQEMFCDKGPWRKNTGAAGMSTRIR